MQALVLYWSKTGNTEKVAQTIHAALEHAHIPVTLARTEAADTLDWYVYDLICFGFPAYRWSPPRPVDDYLRRKFAAYRKIAGVQLGAPPLPGKHALIFCTYSGPHTGIHEARPAVLYAGQFFEHLGFPILDELYVVGEFHGNEAASTQGRLGDIRERPNADDLSIVTQSLALLLPRITPPQPAEP